MYQEIDLKINAWNGRINEGGCEFSRLSGGFREFWAL